MINTVVFDLGGVLVDFHPEEGLKSLGASEEETADIMKKVFPHPWEDLDRDPCTPQQFAAVLKKAAPGHDEIFDRLSVNTEVLTGVRPYTENWLKSLKERGFRVLILSNYGQTTYERNSKTYDFLRLTDGQLISYRERMIKPDPAIYKRLMERFNVKAEEAVFIDDRENNAEGARNVGMHAVAFENFEQCSSALEQLIREEA